MALNILKTYFWLTKILHALRVTAGTGYPAVLHSGLVLCAAHAGRRIWVAAGISPPLFPEYHRDGGDRLQQNHRYALALLHGIGCVLAEAVP